MRAVGREHARPAIGIAERNQVLAEQPQAYRRAVRLSQLGGEHGRQPEAPEYLAHGRPRPDAGDELVLLLAEHQLLSSPRSAALCTNEGSSTWAKSKFSAFLFCALMAGMMSANCSSLGYGSTGWMALWYSYMYLTVRSSSVL